MLSKSLKDIKVLFGFKKVIGVIVFLIPPTSLVAAPNDTRVTPTVSSDLDVEFDSKFISQDAGGAVDLSRFKQGGFVMPGNYSVDLYVNGDWIGRALVPFKILQGEIKKNAQPCFDKKLLLLLNIDFKSIPSDVVQALNDINTCFPISEIISGAASNFALDDQRLDLTIQQISLSRSPRGYVSSEFWDKGVNASFLGYDFNQYRYSAHGQGGQQTFSYLGLNAGVNIGDWQLRHNGSYSKSSGAKSDYQSLESYVQRGLPVISSKLVLGESYTTGELFDSTRFRGVRLFTDDRMLPDSLRGYAPTVRGVATSNAKVTIKQNGVTIYESTVAPGSFEINDLYATGYGGDLNVYVREADGSEHSFSVPYAAVPLSLRPGANRYSVTAGKLINPNISNDVTFTQLSLQHGFTNLFTGYAGINAAQNYTATMFGGAFNTYIGAFGLDLTHAQAKFEKSSDLKGQSIRASYSKSVMETGTNVAIAAYRYSTGGYLDLNSALQLREQLDRNQGFDTILRQRDRAQFTLSQRLGETRGQLNATSSATSYWNRGGSDVNYSFGYSNSFKRVAYSLQVNREYLYNGATDTQYYLSLSMPLGTERPLSLSSSMTRDSNGRAQTQATLSGALGDENRLSYGVTGNHATDSGNTSNSGSANLLYRGSNAEVLGSVGAGSGYRQDSIGIRGAMVSHSGGIIFSQPISDTFGIIEAKDAKGARLLNSSGVEVGSSGYAVVPYLTPYRMNSIDLDPHGLSTDVELQVASQQVAPVAGSVAVVRFATVSGRAAIIRAKQDSGETLPFGAIVIDESNKEVGVVGQGSKIFARGLNDNGELTVRWNEGRQSFCKVKYVLPSRPSDVMNSYQQIDAVCRLESSTRE
ncbi:fimbrial biogenesis outer membrane usher protein [Pseudomonas fragi]|uniref:fimbria/pilus outer membrane usher protein n=1 Tax=Pseudomonas fragi TaxID=296 RepID=UPI0021BF5C6D|nr:fimbria/pilus outer membrane usher protein [Pseudomonas fragi]UXL37064.1 fimbrial biogenesis outer membrane usher protein [Pseudomonas fragi]